MSHSETIKHQETPEKSEKQPEREKDRLPTKEWQIDNRLLISHWNSEHGGVKPAKHRANQNRQVP